MLLGISEMVNARAFKPLPLCSESPWNLTSRNFWSSRNERKPLSKQKCVLRKCCWVSQKWWMLELSNLCHCVQHPRKLTSRDFWSSRNERNPLSKQKCVFLRKWILLSNLCHCVSPPKNSEMKMNSLELSNLCHCVQHPWKLTSKESHFLSKNVFWENAVGYLRFGEC